MIATQTTIGTTATKIIDKDNTTRKIIVHVIGNQVVYLGGSDVTTSTGLYVDKGAGAVRIQLLPNETLYGIVATTPEVVSCLLPDA